MTTSDGPHPRRARRIPGIDVARAVAIIGMVAVHIGPVRLPDPTKGEQLYALPHGRASILFVLLAGVGVSLLAGDRSARRVRRAWARLGWLAAVLVPLGYGLQMLDHGVLVILQYYGLYFLVAGVALHLGDRVLLGLSVAGSVLAPVAYLALWQRFPDAFDALRGAATEVSAADVVRDLFVTGDYPVLVWGVPVLLGVWLGRRDLRAAAVRWWMVGTGLVLAVGAQLASGALVAVVGEPASEPSWRQLADASPHTEMPLWLIGSVGSALVVLGLALVLADGLPRLTWPLAALGQLAFTVYVGHLVVLDVATDLLRYSDVGPAAWSVLRFTVVVVVLSALWRWRFPRGPLEALLRLPWLLPSPGRDRVREQPAQVGPARDAVVRSPDD